MALMLAMVGLALVGGVLVVDIGLMFNERRQVQAAADFASLAAAQDLPRNPADPNVSTKISTAEAVAHSYLEYNGYDEDDADVEHLITTTYGGEVDKIEVVVRRSRPWIFGKLFGLGDITVQGRAVAAANSLQRDVVVTLDRSGSMCIDSHGSFNCGDLEWTTDTAAASSSWPNPVSDSVAADPGDYVVVGATSGNAGNYTPGSGLTENTDSAAGTMTFATASKLATGGSESYSMSHSGPNRQQLVAVALPNNGSAVTPLGSWVEGLNNHVAPAGTDRVLVFVAGFEDEGGADITSVSYGGQPLWLVEKADESSYTSEVGVEIWALDEDGIAAAVGDDFTVNWDEGVTTTKYAAGFFGNVVQGTPYEPFDTMRVAADNFTDNFEPFLDGFPFDRMSLVSYSNDADLDVSLTTDYGTGGSAFSTSLWALTPSGRTNIGHAIAVARQELEDNSTAGQDRVIVLLSDGEPNIYRTGGTDDNPTFSTCSSTPCSSAEDYARDEAEIASAAGIAIYTIGLGDSAGEDLLMDLAEIGAAGIGGGQYFDVDNPDDLDATFKQISELINYALVE